MKASKLIIAAALTSLIASTSPALAQAYNNGPHGTMVAQRHDASYSRDLSGRVSDLRGRLDRGFERHQLTRSEFRRLSNDLNTLSADIRNASRGVRAIDRREFERFDDRLDRFEARLAFERRDNDRGFRR